MIVGRGEGAKTSGREIALVVDVTPEVIKDPLNRTGVREEGETVLERQSVSQNNTVSIPAPYLCIGDASISNLATITHVAPIRGPIPQMIKSVLQGCLIGEGRERSSGDNGSGGWRHCW